jgi:hypothetical protein
MIYQEILKKRNIFSSRTALWLDKHLMTHRPKFFIHGHHHLSSEQDFFGTKFICLNELETYELKEKVI